VQGQHFFGQPNECLAVGYGGGGSRGWHVAGRVARITARRGLDFMSRLLYL
jgi:hypothetical protein